MKRSNILEERRAHVSPEVRKAVNLSFQIVDRIHAVLESKGLKQKDLAEKLGKSEAEISKWMRGTHNFTIDTIAKIAIVLGDDIITTTHTIKPYSLPADSHQMVAEREVEAK